MAKRKSKPPAKATNKRKAPLAQETLPEKIVWWCLNALVFMVPLAISNLTYFQWLVPTWQIPVTYDQFDIVKVFTMRALVLIALGAWAWVRLVKGGPLRHSKLDWLVLVLLGWLVLSTITSIHPPTAIFGKYRRFEGLLSFITYAVTFFLTVQTVDRPEKMRGLARTLVISGFIVGLYGVSQFAGVDLIRWGNLPFEAKRAFATYGNPDLLGGYLIFPLSLSLALGLTEKEHWWRVFYWVTFGIVTVAWVVAFVRGAWIGGAVALIVLTWTAWRKKARLETPDRWILGGTATAGVAIVIASFFATSSILNVFERVKSIFLFDRGSARTRFEIWEAAWDAAKDRPITGFGADTFRLVFPKYKPIEYVADAGYLSVADNVHNYPLQMASALGIPGAILLYSVFVRALWVSARDALGKESGERLLLTGFWAAVIGYLTHLTFGLSVTGSTIFLWLCMGVLMVPSARTIEVPPAKGVLRTVIAALIVIVVAIGSYMNVRYIVADNQHLMSKIGVASMSEEIAHAKRAIELNPYNDMYRSELGLVYTKLVIQHINNAEQARSQGQDPTSSLKDAKAAFLLAEGALLDAIDFTPPEYDNYVFLANLYNLAGTYIDPVYFENAVEIAEAGVEAEEYGPAIRVQAGRAYRALKRYDEAIEQLTNAAEMDPDYAEPRFLLAEIFFTTDEHRTSLGWLAQALDREARNPDALAVLQRVMDLVTSEEYTEDDPVVLMMAYALDGEFNGNQSSYETALEYVPAALAEMPDDPMVLRRAAMSHMATGATDEAIAVLEDMAEVTVDEPWRLNIWPLERLADIYEEQGDYATAAEWMEKTFEVDDRKGTYPRQRRIDRLNEAAADGGG